MIDELLQVAELRARRDVEASAVQLPDLVVLHIQPFGVVVVQDRQTVGTWKRKKDSIRIICRYFKDFPLFMTILPLHH